MRIGYRISFCYLQQSFFCRRCNRKWFSRPRRSHAPIQPALINHSSAFKLSRAPTPSHSRDDSAWINPLIATGGVPFIHRIKTRPRIDSTRELSPKIRTKAGVYCDARCSVAWPTGPALGRLPRFGCAMDMERHPRLAPRSIGLVYLCERMGRKKNCATRLSKDDSMPEAPSGCSGQRLLARRKRGSFTRNWILEVIEVTHN